MPETIYDYALSDFPNQKCAGDRLQKEIRESDMSYAIRSAPTGVGGGDPVLVTVSDVLSAEDEAKLDALVAAHTGEALTQAPTTVTISGQPRVHPSPRPSDLITFFSSHGDDDNGVVGGGAAQLLFDLTAGDASKDIELTYKEVVHIKDGFIMCVDAPFGASVSAEVYTPDGSQKVGAFVVKALILGTGWFPFDTEDYGTLPTGFRLRLTVHNSETVPAAFKVAARVEMFRANGVQVPV